METKTVQMSITVPNNDYCFDGITVCDHFDNEGGHGMCAVRLDYGCNIDCIGGMYKKPERCRNLK